MLLFLGVLIVMFVLFCIFILPAVWDRYDSLENAISIGIGIIGSGGVAIVVMLVAVLIVMNTTPTEEKVVDKTTIMLPVSLNGGEVALGDEVIPSAANGKWYVYRDEQDNGTKYLFIEQTDEPVDFGIDVKLVDAKKCEIRYIDNEELCLAEFYHTEYTGAARLVMGRKKDTGLVTLYVHKGSVEDIWFPYSN